MMGLFEHFPYTNFHDLNLDWIIKMVKSFDHRVDHVESELNEELEERVDAYIDQHLSQFILGAMYDAANTAIRLQQAEVIGDSDHVYNQQREQIIVLEGR